MRQYVLLKTSGGAKLIGPFSLFEDAAKYLMDNALMGYMVAPMETPARPDLSEDELREEFQSWAVSSSSPRWVGSLMNMYEVQRNISNFLDAARKKYPELFGLDEHGNNTGRVYKIQLIKGVREWGQKVNSYKSPIGLKEAKDGVDEYFLKEGI